MQVWYNLAIADLTAVPSKGNLAVATSTSCVLLCFSVTFLEIPNVICRIELSTFGSQLADNSGPSGCITPRQARTMLLTW